MQIRDGEAGLERKRDVGKSRTEGAFFSSNADGARLSERAFHAGPRARALIDGQGAVRHANARGAEMLGRAIGLTIRKGKLAAVDVRDEAALAAAVTDLTEGIERRLLLHGADASLVKVRVVLIPGGDGEVLLEFEPVQPPQDRAPPAISHVFGLTRAETQVLELLCKGLSSDEVAHRLGVSRATARTHAKRLYAKLSVSSRGELMALLLTFA